jgi:hypothetical protein
MLDQGNMQRVVEVLQGLAATSASLHRLVRQPAELMLESATSVIADALSYQQVVLITRSDDCTKLLVSSSHAELTDGMMAGDLNTLIEQLRSEITAPECIIAANLPVELAEDANSLGLSDWFLNNCS